jgi:prepilin-type N-terminal cleavage/methylation domain-containing protein
VRSRPRGNFRHGVSLVELLIALSISAALLTATGVAVDSAFKSYSINQERSSMQQRARLAVYRIQTYVRTCKEHAPITSTKVAQFATGTIVTDTGIAMFTNAGNELTFEIDPVKKQLLMLDGVTKHVLLEGVDLFTVKMEPLKSAAALKTGGNYDLLKRASIVLTLHPTDDGADTNTDGQSQTITLSASVMPRRNSW